jgi:hypothetical protein
VRQSGEPAPSIWHPEFWDRFIRNDHHFASALAYIHNNPVKAGLVALPEDWPWSSANFGNVGPGNAGLRTRIASAARASAEPRVPGSAGLRTRISSLPASAAPRAPGASAVPRAPGASAEPRVPGASAEPRVPGASAEPRVPSAEPRVPGAAVEPRISSSTMASAEPRVPRK